MESIIHYGDQKFPPWNPYLRNGLYFLGQTKTGISEFRIPGCRLSIRWMTLGHSFSVLSYESANLKECVGSNIWVKSAGGMLLTDESEVLGETLVLVPLFFTVNPTWHVQRSNTSVLYVDRPATNRRSYGTNYPDEGLIDMGQGWNDNWQPEPKVVRALRPRWILYRLSWNLTLACAVSCCD
jgi:hypothetical protein